ncbi:MAG TPA: serine protease, partial [Hyphomonadaceae bacterium]|nr:serine protease [Hyphomonadaceae bacterium]
SAINEGRVVRPWVGLRGQAVTAEIARSMELERPGGLLVTEIYPDGPADLAGLRRGDLLLKFDGRDVFDENGLRFLSATLAAGDSAPISILRNGEQRTLNMTVTAPPGATDAELILLEGENPLSGAEVANLSPALAEELRRDPFDEGVLVNRIVRRSYAYRSGVRPGDIVIEVNGHAITTVEELEEALNAEAEDGSKLRVWQIAVDRNGRRLSQSFRL